MAAEASPAFPVELEREIFELVAFLYPECMPSLLLVALRVKTWIEPMLYRVLFLYCSVGHRPERALTTDTFEVLLKARPTLFQKFLRHMWLDSLDGSDVLPTISICHDIVDLAVLDLPSSDKDLSQIIALPLQRLHVAILDMHNKHGIFASFRSSQITHFSVGIYIGATSEDWFGLAQIPHLTHFSFAENQCPLSVCQALLRQCPRLEVLASVSSQQSDIYRSASAYDALVGSEPRFVMLVMTDPRANWEVGARGAPLIGEESVVV
ncbi:hypothetical protein C8R43DRAFT_1139854 [Mycena crocata]|nr:hypothetical protein C8R43DRAFT_1139854 [Mycena crocata]